MNFQYQTKPIRVEAFQLPPEDEMTRAMPTWFTNGIRNRTIIPADNGAVNITIGGNLALPMRMIRCNVGDWIIKCKDSYEICYDVDFQERYEFVGDPNS